MRLLFKFWKHFFILLFIILLLILISYTFYIKESFDESSKPNIVLIISRYNENLEWLKKDPFNKYPVYIYNKGKNDDFYRPENTIEVVSIENVGRESHTYLYHIIQHYDELNDILIFLTGSNDLNHRFEKSKRIIEEIEKNNSAVFIAHSTNNVRNDLYNFTIDNYICSHPSNSSDAVHSIDPAPIRPFGKWFEDKFGDVTVTNIALNGMFSVSKQDVLNKPKSFYEDLIKDLDHHSHPEAGHYFERSWEAIFYPMNHTTFLEGFTLL